MTIQEEMAARAEKRKAASRKAKQQSIATARALKHESEKKPVDEAAAQADRGKGTKMTANAIFGVIGTMIGGAACFFLGYHCALRWGAADLLMRELERNGVVEPLNDTLSRKVLIANTEGEAPK